MKIQIHDDHWRLRLDEDELAALCVGETITCRSRLPRGLSISFFLRAHDHTDATVRGESDGWHVDVPRAPVVELQSRLPDRDGLSFDLAHDPAVAFRLRLQVDVHDSKRRRRAASAAA